MSKYSFVSACILSVVACTLVASQAKAPSGNWEHLLSGSRILAGADAAWIVQEPKVVSTGYVEGMMFGPGPNEAVFLVRQNEVLKAEAALNPRNPQAYQSGGRLQIVNLTNGSSRQVKLPPEMSPVTGVNWVNEGRLLLVFYGKNDDSAVCIYDLIGGGVYPAGDFYSFDLTESEIPSVTMLIWTDHTKPQRPGVMRLIDFSAGAPRVKDYSMPEEVRTPLLLTKNFTVLAISTSNDYLEINLANGSMKRWTVEEGRRHFGLDKDAERKERLNTVIQNDPKPGLYLSTTPGFRSDFRLSKEADRALINSQENKVLFAAHGVAFLSDLVPINLEVAVKALTQNAIEQAKIIAKQNATSAMIYASDYDDVLPFSSASARDALHPYIKNRFLQDNVIWTNLMGQKLTELSDPSKTELGYVPGPGGRAIIFADSHVEWRPNP